jgi:hypothetical protein
MALESDFRFEVLNIRSLGEFKLEESGGFTRLIEI